VQAVAGASAGVKMLMTLSGKYPLVLNARHGHWCYC